MRKINLNEIPTIDSIFSSENNFSDLQYKTITSFLREHDELTSLCVLLVCVKEQRKIFENIMEKEFLLVEKNNNEDGFYDSYVLFTLTSIFTAPQEMLSTCVFDSLSKVAETSLVNYFSAELIIVRDIIVSHLSEYTTKHEGITLDDENYISVATKCTKLINMVSNMKKITQDSMQRTAQDFLGAKTPEEQFAFFTLFLKRHFHDKWNESLLLGNEKKNSALVENTAQLTHSTRHNTDVIDVEEEELDNEPNGEYSGDFGRIKELLIDINERLTDIESKDKKIPALALTISSLEKQLVNNTDTTAESVLEVSRIVLTLSQRLENIESSLGSKVDKMNDSFNQLNNNFNSFLERQAKAEVILKQKYSLEF